MSQWEFPHLSRVSPNSTRLLLTCLASFCAFNAMQNAKIMSWIVFLKQQRNGCAQLVMQFHRSVCRSRWCPFHNQVAEMAVKHCAYCVKVVNVTACYCPGTCTEQSYCYKKCLSSAATLLKWGGRHWN